MKTKKKSFILLLPNKICQFTALLCLGLFLAPAVSGMFDRASLPQPRVLGAISPFNIRGEEAAPPTPPLPALTKPLNLDNLLAESALSFDVDSNATLVEKNIDKPLPIASLTKLITALVVYDNLKMEDYITIERNDTLSIKPILGLKAGDQVKIYDLLNSMLIGSCNDAALTLANHASKKAGVPFDLLMNQKAAALGMAGSHFSNPMGFDSSSNYATASDIRRVILETQKYSIFSMAGRKRAYSFTGQNGNTYSVKSSNSLVSQDPEVSNIKTGFTQAARGSMATTITHGGHTIVVIVLGSSNREQDTEYLKDLVFSSFQWR